jgi:hypothetical protein
MDVNVERLLREILEAIRTQNLLLLKTNHILKQQFNRVLGGVMTQIGDPMNPIQPGNTVKFLVTPTFSGAAFALVAAQAAIASSDNTNFPVSLDPADPTGATFESVISGSAVIPTGGEAVTVTWTYTNTDGTTATVTGTVTEEGIVDDVTGGTFTQVS